MKTTLELPDALVREIKLKAVLEGRKLKDTVADLLRAGLAARPRPSGAPQPKAMRSLPVVACRHAATPDTEMTADRVAAELARQERAWHAKPRR